MPSHRHFDRPPLPSRSAGEGKDSDRRSSGFVLSLIMRMLFHGSSAKAWYNQPMAMNLTISLPEDLKAFIDERTKSGQFNSTGEFIQQLVREDQERAEKERLERMLLNGLEGGAPIRATDA